MTKATFIINGMHCASCSSNVEKSLKKLPSIKSASVSLLFKKGSIEFDGSISEQMIKDAVKRVGYEAKEIKIG